MLGVRWASEATGDLADIISYIEERNPLAAGQLLDDILQTVEGLPDMLFYSGPAEFPAHVKW